MRPGLSENAYRGRFAPSPTGPLHFGSLVAAFGSWLDARSQAGQWLVRIEDIDRQREVPGSADSILRMLDAFGLDWDGPVMYQSRRTEAYADALDHLRRDGLLYDCACSRREVAAAGRLGPEGYIYPGTCRRGLPPGRKSRALRIRVEYGPTGFQDRIFGDRCQDLSGDVGDFVLRRADGIHAYQLGVVVDDAYQGVTHVVRGADLLSSTPRQIFLQRAIGLPTPCYAHLPIVVDGRGRKLSKSDAATPVDPKDPVPALLRAWSFLGQPTFPEYPASLAELREYALNAWDSNRVPAELTRLASGHR